MEPVTIPSIIYPDAERTNKYIAREDYFEQIKENLSLSGRVALVGMHHVGKSLTAIHYYDYEKNYKEYEGYLIYFNATSEEEFLKKYTEFAWLQKITPINPEINQGLIAKINEHVKNHAFLFIFDNVTEEGWVEKYLPESKKTHIILTSRKPITLCSIPNIEMKPFTRNDSLKYIKKNLNRKCYGGSNQNAFVRADELANRLNDSPVNLEKAIDYMNSTVVTIPQFLDTRFKFAFP